MGIPPKLIFFRLEVSISITKPRGEAEQTSVSDQWLYGRVDDVVDEVLKGSEGYGFDGDYIGDVEDARAGSDGSR